MTTFEYRARVKQCLKEQISTRIEQIVYITCAACNEGEDWDLLADELRDLASDMFCDAYRIAAYAGNAKKRANKANGVREQETSNE